jgi:hypothetical protein
VEFRSPTNVVSSLIRRHRHAYAHVNVAQLAPSIDAAPAAWSTKSAPGEQAKREKIRRVK